MLETSKVIEIIRKRVTADPVYGLQGVEKAAVEIVLLTIHTDD